MFRIDWLVTSIRHCCRADPACEHDLRYHYENDILQVKQLISDLLEADPHVLKDPVPDIFVSAHADSSVNILVRPWCASEHFLDVYFGTMEDLELDFDREGITIPFPERDVHIKGGTA